MPEARVSQAGIAIELEQQTPGIEVFQAGMLVEAGFEGVGITKLGMLIEIGADSLHVTKFGLLVELDPKELPVATHFERFNPGPAPHILLPEPVTGYQLDENGSFWATVTPHESKNLAENGSFEGELTPSQTVGGVWTINEFDSSLASRGFRSRKLVNIDGDTGNVLQAYNIQGPTYVTWSFDLYMRKEHTFEVSIRLGSNPTTAIATGTLIANDKNQWRRYSFTYYDNDTQVDRTRLVRLRTDGINGADFNTDGWQIETLAFSTTYFDGDLKEYAYDADPYAFAWQSIRYLSPSIRSARTMNGGKEVSFEEFDFRTTAVVGLGMGDVTLDTAILASGEEILKDAFISGKEFSIIGKIFGKTPQEIAAKRNAIINTLNILNSRSGALMLGYQPVDRRGRPYGKKLWIYATFISGMGQNYTSHYQENLELRFKVFNAKMFDEFGSVQELNIGGEPEFDTTIYARNANTGEIEPYLVGSNSTTGGTVRCAVILDDGSLLVGGSFTSIGGVSAKRTAKFNSGTQAWEEFGTGFDDGEVWALAVGRGDYDGRAIAVGSFTLLGDGVTACNRVAVEDEDAEWSQLGGGFDDVVRDIDVFPSGEILVGGEFRNNAAGTVPMYAVAWFNATLASSSTDWQAITTGSVGDVFCVKIGPDKTFYFGGDFEDLGGNGNCNFIASHIINSGTINPLVQGLDEDVWDIEFGPDGYLYLVGAFDADFQQARQLRHFCKWTGREFEEVGRGEIANTLHYLAWDKRGYAYIGGAQGVDGDYEVDGFTGFTSLYQWTGSTWVSADMRTIKISAPATGKIVVTTDGTFILPTFGGTSLRISGHTEINYEGTADAPVKIKVSGPCILHKISNWTIGKHIYFKSFVIEDGEDFYLDLTSLFPIAYTTHRDNVLDDILISVSDIDAFKLVPGVNNITILMGGTFDDSTAAYLQWNEHFWSVDPASET